MAAFVVPHGHARLGPHWIWMRRGGRCAVVRQSEVVSVRMRWLVRCLRVRGNGRDDSFDAGTPDRRVGDGGLARGMRRVAARHGRERRNRPAVADAGAQLRRLPSELRRRGRRRPLEADGRAFARRLMVRGVIRARNRGKSMTAVGVEGRRGRDQRRAPRQADGREDGARNGRHNARKHGLDAGSLSRRRIERDGRRRRRRRRCRGQMLAAGGVYRPAGDDAVAKGMRLLHALRVAGLVRAAASANSRLFRSILLVQRGSWRCAGLDIARVWQRAMTTNTLDHQNRIARIPRE